MFLLFIVFILTLSCASTYNKRQESITPESRIQIAYFYVTIEDGREFFLNAINFVETGEMWIFWTDPASDYPEFLDVFQIDHGRRWSLPFRFRSGEKVVSVKDYVADLFEKTLQEKVEIKVIER